MKIEKQIALLQRRLAEVLMEKLRDGRHFTVEIRGVRSQITDVRVGEVKKELDREIVIYEFIDL